MSIPNTYLPSYSPESLRNSADQLYFAAAELERLREVVEDLLADRDRLRVENERMRKERQ